MKFGKKEIQISFKYVILIAMLYLIIPICIFFIGWTKLYIGLPLTIFLLFALYRFYVSTYKESVEQISVSGMHLFFTFLFLALWVWSTGIGNFFVSAYDHPWRIAMFRDLVDYDWPVIYPETGNAFVYYLCYWMVPALFGKLFGWIAGNVVLLLWTYLGVLIVFFILLHIFNASNPKKMWTVALILFGWGGLNVVAAIIIQILNLNPYEFGLNDFVNWTSKMWNGYSFHFYYRSNDDALMEIYNQATPLWIATLLAYDNRKRVENYAFIGMCLIPFAPLPFIGLFILFISFFIREIIDKREFIKVFRSAFSMQNIIAILAIAPIFLLFYTCNSTTQGGEGGGLMLLPFELFDGQRIFMLVAFWLFQFGIVAALIYSEYRRKYLYYIVVTWLMICPLIEFGKRGGRDFCMNASLPALFLLMCMTIKYINKEVIDKILTVRNTILIGVLLVSSMTAMGEIAGKLDQIGNSGQFPIVNDQVYTYADKETDGYENFLVSEWGQSVFYQYIAK